MVSGRVRSRIGDGRGVEHDFVQRPNGLYQRVRFRFGEWLTGYANERRAFQSRHGYPLNLAHPRTFSEKICWRKIYDRNPLLPRVVDKYAVRKYVTEALGERRAQRVLVPLLFETKEPAKIPFHAISGDYIIKANHGSGMNLIVLASAGLETRPIVERCQYWLTYPFGFDKHEWAYQKVDRRIVVESLLDDGRGRPPREYKFHMFHGKCALIQVVNSAGWTMMFNHLAHHADRPRPVDTDAKRRRRLIAGSGRDRSACGRLPRDLRRLQEPAAARSGRARVPRASPGSNGVPRRRTAGCPCVGDVDGVSPVRVQGDVVLRQQHACDPCIGRRLVDGGARAASGP